VAEAARETAPASLPSGGQRAATLLILLAIAISDKVDGFLARRTARTVETRQPPKTKRAIIERMQKGVASTG
jgi:hypothetical protein